VAAIRAPVRKRSLPFAGRRSGTTAEPFNELTFSPSTAGLSDQCDWLARTSTATGPPTDEFPADRSSTRATPTTTAGEGTRR
jgi:hypothetical protein